MRFALLSLLSILLAASPAAAGELSPTHRAAVDRIIDRALTDEVAFEVVESLTTEVGPRLAGSPAEARAREWAKAKLQKLGFSRVRIEPFRIRRWVRHAESARIVAPFPQKLLVTALGHSVATPKGGLTADVVRFRTMAELREAPREGLEGKIVFVDEHMTRAQDGTGYGLAVQMRSGAANEAAKRGAAAALIRSVGTDHHRFPHTGAMRYEEGLTPVPIGALAAPDADQLTRALRRGRVQVELRLDVEGGGRTGSVWEADEADLVPSGNVVAEIPGRTDEVVLVGAHLDSWDLGTGALDDGAGVGIVVAAALALKGEVKRPRRTVRVVLFGAEEVGLGGAKAYAERYAKSLGRHVLAAESDFGARKIWRMQTRWGEGALEHAPLFHRALRRLGVAGKGNDAWGGPDLHFLREAGVPVVSLTQNGWDYFDYHHTPDDTLDKIDVEELRQNVAAYAAFLYLASELGLDFRAGAKPVAAKVERGEPSKSR